MRSRLVRKKSLTSASPHSTSSTRKALLLPRTAFSWPADAVAAVVAEAAAVVAVVAVVAAAAAAAAAAVAAVCPGVLAAFAKQELRLT